MFGIDLIEVKTWMFLTHLLHGDVPLCHGVLQNKHGRMYQYISFLLDISCNNFPFKVFTLTYDNYKEMQWIKQSSSCSGCNHKIFCESGISIIYVVLAWLHEIDQELQLRKGSSQKIRFKATILESSFTSRWLPEKTTGWLPRSFWGFTMFMPIS